MTQDQQPQPVCPECGEEAASNAHCRLCVVHDGRCRACEDATGGACPRHWDDDDSGDVHWYGSSRLERRTLASAAKRSNRRGAPAAKPVRPAAKGSPPRRAVGKRPTRPARAVRDVTAREVRAPVVCAPCVAEARAMHEQLVLLELEQEIERGSYEQTD